MACGDSESTYDLRGTKIQTTFQRLVQVVPEPTSANETRTDKNRLYDGRGNEITGVEFQEAFERDEDGNLQPTTGSFTDPFWTLDDDGNRTPKDIKFWLDNEYNLISLPEDKTDLEPEPFNGKVENAYYSLRRTSVTGSYNVKLNDHLLGVDTNSTELTLTLPSASLGTQTFIIKDEGNNFSGNQVTIVSEDPEDLFEDDQDELILTANNSSITIYSNGINKYFII